MNSKWYYLKIGDLCNSIISGGTPKSTVEEYYGGKIPWLNTKEIGFNRIYFTEKYITEKGLKESSAKLVPKNSVIIAMYGATAGKSAINKIDLSTNQACCNLIINSLKADYEFVYYQIFNNYNKLVNLSSGAAQQNLNVSTIKNFKIKIPNLKYQKKIACVLSFLDKKIDLNKRINQNLEKQILNIFKKWFFNFEFLENGEGYDGSYKDSEWGLIPKMWNIKYLGTDSEYSIINSGINKFNNEKIYIATADVSDSVFTNLNTHVTWDERPSRANMQPINKSVWFAKMKDSRKLIMVDDYSKEIINNYIFSTGFCGLKCSNELFYYIWTFILTKRFDDIKNNLCNGTTMQAINNSNVKKISFILPDKDILMRFNKIAEPIYKIIYFNNKEINKLAKLRDTLLPKLMSGEIDVSKIEI